MGAVWGAPHSALELREEVAPETVEFAGFLESVCFRPVIFCFANLSAMKADLLFDEIVGCFYGIWHIASRMWLSRCTQQWPPLGHHRSGRGPIARLITSGPHFPEAALGTLRVHSHRRQHE